MIKNTILLLTLLLFLAACGQRPSDKLKLNAEDLNVGELKISPETMNQILQDIPAPSEMATQIHSLGIPYSASYLADAKLLGALSDASPSSDNSKLFEMAFSLGILYADLGYLNVNDKAGSELDHLTAINALAEALEIGQFFDLSTMKRLASGGSDHDSLIIESIVSFNNMENHLRNSGRSEQGALMITGAWMESLYLATQVASNFDHEDLRLLIGEQKLILNDLLLVLGNFKNETAIQDYISELDELKSVYDQVKITYEVSAPQVVDQDGLVIVVQSETSDVEMSDEILQDIIDVVREVRGLYVNNDK